MFLLKKIAFTIYILCLYVSLHAQTLTPTVVAGGGGFSVNASVGSLSYTIGESITTTTHDANYILTQGFQQPEEIDSPNFVPFVSGADFNVWVYPNPVSNALNVFIKSSTPHLFSVQLFDVLGRKVSEPVNNNSQSSSTSFLLNTSSLCSGIYMLNISASDINGFNTFKIVKINQ